MNRSMIIQASVAAVIFAASPALAGEAHSAAVLVWASDFATPQARIALDKRIRSAAEELCGANAVAEDMSWGAIKECRVQVRDIMYGQLAPLNPSNAARHNAR
jgi:UrcA family protein